MRGLEGLGKIQESDRCMDCYSEKGFRFWASGNPELLNVHDAV